MFACIRPRRGLRPASPAPLSQADHFSRQPGRPRSHQPVRWRCMSFVRTRPTPWSCRLVLIARRRRALTEELQRDLLLAAFLRESLLPMRIPPEDRLLCHHELDEGHALVVLVECL